MIKVEILLASSLSLHLPFLPISVSHMKDLTSYEYKYAIPTYTFWHTCQVIYLFMLGTDTYMYWGWWGSAKKLLDSFIICTSWSCCMQWINKPHNFILHYVMLSVRCSCDGEGCRCWRGLYANSPTRLSFWPQKSSWQYHSFQHLDLKTSRGHQCTQWAESQGSVDGFLFHTSIHLK